MTERLPPGLTGDLDVLAFAEAELAAGRPAALISIVSLDGPFSRPLGAQLAVAGDKRFAGSISGGCLEQALTEEAQIAMKEGTNRTLRYGTGSPYLDVRLPCGGGIDLYVDVNVDRALLQRAIALGRARRSFSLLFDPATTRSSLRVEEQNEQAKPGEFVRRFDPKLRIVLAGRGWEIVAMSQLAQTADVELVVASQEPATLEFCRTLLDIAIRWKHRVGAVARAAGLAAIDAEAIARHHRLPGDLIAHRPAQALALKCVGHVPSPLPNRLKPDVPTVTCILQVTR